MSPPVPSASKGLSERRSVKSDTSPVAHRSALPSGKSPQHRVSQVLLAPPVSLYALRKKAAAKDPAPHSESCSVLTAPLQCCHTAMPATSQKPLRLDQVVSGEGKGQEGGGGGQASVPASRRPPVEVQLTNQCAVYRQGLLLPPHRSRGVR